MYCSCALNHLVFIHSLVAWWQCKSPLGNLFILVWVMWWIMKKFQSIFLVEITISKLVVKIAVYFDKEIMYIKSWTWFLPSLAHQKMNDNQKQPTFYYHSNHFLREISSYTHFRQNNQNDLPILFYICSREHVLTQ